MKNRHIQKEPKAQWENNLAEWKASLPPERLAKDEKRLQEIFALAAKAPVMAEALEWAKNHGVQFIIDRKCQRAGGYYTAGTGVVAINYAWSSTGPCIAEIITHEIRHAWQDYHHMIPTVSTDFQQYYIKKGLIEADASAHGRLASWQYLQHSGSEKEKNEDSILWKNFTSWYASQAGPYGRIYSNIYGVRLGIPGLTPPSFNAEYVGTEKKFTGIDISHHENLHHLGKKFGGGNYFPDSSHDFMQKKSLSASLALSFHNAANHNDKKLVTEIRKRQLRLKLHKGREVLI